VPRAGAVTVDARPLNPSLVPQPRDYGIGEGRSLVKRRGMQSHPPGYRVADRKIHLSQPTPATEFAGCPKAHGGAVPTGCISAKWLNAKIASVTHIGVDALAPS
jgi:hypothetical protein